MGEGETDTQTDRQTGRAALTVLEHAWERERQTNTDRQSCAVLEEHAWERGRQTDRQREPH